MEERLDRIFSNINGWLKFAEAKNAIIIGLNGASIWAIPKLADSQYLNMKSIHIAILISLLICGIVLALFSFFPLTVVPFHWLLGKNAVTNADNLLFYNDIKKYNSYDYLEKLFESVNESRRDYTKIELHYANQIIVNSKITSYKYFMFKLAITADLLMILITGWFLI